MTASIQWCGGSSSVAAAHKRNETDVRSSSRAKSEQGGRIPAGCPASCCAPGARRRSQWQSMHKIRRVRSRREMAAGTAVGTHAPSADTAQASAAVWLWEVRATRGVWSGGVRAGEIGGEPRANHSRIRHRRQPSFPSTTPRASSAHLPTPGRIRVRVRVRVGGRPPRCVMSCWLGVVVLIPYLLKRARLHPELVVQTVVLGLHAVHEGCATSAYAGWG